MILPDMLGTEPQLFLLKTKLASRAIVCQLPLLGVTPDPRSGRPGPSFKVQLMRVIRTETIKRRRDGVLARRPQ